MKILIALMLVCSASAFASKPQVGENANPEYQNCLAEDKCPSQQCANSCAMKNNSQFKEDRGTASNAPKRNGKSKATAQ